MGGIEADETLGSVVSHTGASGSFAVGIQAAGRYKIVRFVASGGMGEVYAAHDLVLDTTVALKTLRPELEGSSTAIERLRREIALARTVTNEHICRLHDVGEHEGRVFLTMELLEGRTLAEIVKDGALAPDVVERFAGQLVDGLSALHHAGIIHRDFKTSNVIVVGERDAARAVITDFGLARSIDAGDARLTVESSLLGTPAYMAPEQVQARPATTASDIYAFGVVLFELLTGKLPFDEDTAMATATARLDRDPPRPSSVKKDVSSRWDAIVLRCLARDPDKRFARIEDVLGAQPRSRRWFLAAGGGGVLGALGFGLWRGCVRDDPSGASSEDIIAVLPVGGATTLFEDPWRTAITLDLHDALATTGLPLVGIDEGDMAPQSYGTAVLLAAERDPIAAALAIPRVTTVVQTSIATRTADRIEVDVTITGGVADGWEQRFSRPLAQAALLASDVAVALAEVLGAAPPRLPRDSARITAEIYEEYGHALASKYRTRTPAEIEAAEKSANKPPPPGKLLRDVVKKFPDLARAAVRLADVVVAQAEQNQADATPQLDRVTALCDRALSIDPDHALAHAVKGHADMVRWNWTEADASTRRALELAPSDERVAYHRIYCFVLMGRFDEAIVLAERFWLARNPRAIHAQGNVGWAYFFGRRWPEAVRHFEPLVRDLDPEHEKFVLLLMFLAQAYAEMSRVDDAIATAKRAREASNDDKYALAGLVPVYVMVGRLDEAKAIRERVGDIDPYSMAVMADAFGEIDTALTHLEKVVAAHNAHAMFIKVERLTALLRSHPRFQALLHTVGLG